MQISEFVDVLRCKLDSPSPSRPKVKKLRTEFSLYDRRMNGRCTGDVLRCPSLMRACSYQRSIPFTNMKAARTEPLEDRIDRDCSRKEIATEPARLN
jgi:hypothetical protein